MHRETLELPDELRRQIRESLGPLGVQKAIVFGSYANGRADQDSGIDLIVVLDSEAVPATYRDRMLNRLRVRRALDAVNRNYALDLLVYTDCRYPGDVGLMPTGKPTEDDAARFERFAGHVHAVVLSLLS
jgi:predicted nucleotidyltransferase